VGFDVLTTCQPSTVWCSRERLPAAAAQPAKVRQSCSATDWLIDWLDEHNGETVLGVMCVRPSCSFSCETIELILMKFGIDALSVNVTLVRLSSLRTGFIWYRAGIIGELSNFLSLKRWGCHDHPSDCFGFSRTTVLSVVSMLKMYLLQGSCNHLHVDRTPQISSRPSSSS
jgi:hypothetical protein